MDNQTTQYYKNILLREMKNEISFNNIDNENYDKAHKI